MFDTNHRNVTITIQTSAFLIYIFLNYYFVSVPVLGIWECEREVAADTEHAIDKNNVATVMVVRRLIVAILVILFSKDTPTQHLYNIFARNNVQHYLKLNNYCCVIAQSKHNSFDIIYYNIIYIIPSDSYNYKKKTLIIISKTTNSLGNIFFAFP